ncbi:hypothetical protein BGZ68_007513 [Mortierella alpina]|nr:hypothetical protein BGZ68_007513 [Mortierella alpina]
MARLIMFALLVLALIQVSLALPYGPSVIFNLEANGVLKGKRNQVPIVERNNLQGPIWEIQMFEEGASIYLPEASEYLNVEEYTNEVVIEGGEFEWRIESAGPGAFKIKLPNVDSLLDWDVNSQKVILQPAKESPSQLWLIKRPFHYSRMYRQF